MDKQKQASALKPGAEKVAHLQLRVPESLHEHLRRMSFDTRRSQNEIMLQALSQYLKERGIALDRPLG